MIGKERSACQIGRRSSGSNFKFKDVVTQALCSQHYRQLGLQGLHQLYAHRPVNSEMRSCISIGDGKSSHCCSDICSLGAGGLSRSAVAYWRMPFSSERLHIVTVVNVCSSPACNGHGASLVFDQPALSEHKF